MRHDGQWCTAIGVLADSCGITQWQQNRVNRSIGPGGREFISIDRRVESAIETAAAYSSVQPSSIALRWSHGDEIGHVVQRHSSQQMAKSQLGQSVVMGAGAAASES